MPCRQPLATSVTTRPFPLEHLIDLVNDVICEITGSPATLKLTALAHGLLMAELMAG